jgi:hypothetical protein
LNGDAAENEENTMVHQDLSKATHEQLIAEIARLKALANGPKIAWAKDKDGNDKVGEAINLIFPGKRARYLEVEEMEYIRDHCDELIESLVG